MLKSFSRDDRGGPTVAVKLGPKGRALLDGAAGLFLEQGFEAVSLDAIVAQVGGSKSSIYRFFGSKDGLFAALVHRECERITEPLRQERRRCAGDGEDAAFVLARIGRAYLQIITDERALGLHRLIVAQSKRFPELAALFVQSGPESAIALIEEAIRDLQARGMVEPVIGPQAAARRFTHLLRGDVQARLLLGVGDPPGPDEATRLIEEALLVLMPLVLPRFGGRF